MEEPGRGEGILKKRESRLAEARRGPGIDGQKHAPPPHLSVTPGFRVLHTSPPSARVHTLIPGQVTQRTQMPPKLFSVTGLTSGMVAPPTGWDRHPGAAEAPLTALHIPGTLKFWPSSDHTSAHSALPPLPKLVSPLAVSHSSSPGSFYTA